MVLGSAAILVGFALGAWTRGGPCDCLCRCGGGLRNPLRGLRPEPAAQEEPAAPAAPAAPVRGGQTTTP
eukprot:9948386-Heterocapsa_arctica.AAC.1